MLIKPLLWSSWFLENLGSRFRTFVLKDDKPSSFGFRKKIPKINNSLILRLGTIFKLLVLRSMVLALWEPFVPISRWDQILTLIWDNFKVNFKVRFEFQIFSIETSFEHLLFIRSMNGDHINVIGTCFPLGSQSSMMLTLIHNSLPSFF
jgi:hypothetical protein